METFEFSDSTFLDNSHVIPKIATVANKEWVPWGDKGKNDYPEKLISLLDNSSLHNAIVYSKAAQIAGNGFIFEESDPAAEATAEFLKDINPHDEDANEVLAKLALDYTVFGAYAMAITWSRDWSRITAVEHISIDKLRAAKVDLLGKVPGYYYSFDWSTYRPVKTFLPCFNARSKEDRGKAYKETLKRIEAGDQDIDKSILQGKDNTQILVHKPYRPGTFYYPIPSYAGAITAIEADIQSDQYGLNSLKNSMDVGFVVKIFKKIDPAAKREAAAAFYKMYTSSKNAGKPMLIFAETAEDAPQIEKLGANDVDKRYISVNENSLQKILAGHRITSPLLVGIPVAGKLGGSSEIKEAQELFYATCIAPDQHQICKSFNKLMEINGLSALAIEPNNPFNTEPEEDQDNNNEIEGEEEQTAPEVKEEEDQENE